MSYGREHFMGANISWAQTFHGRKHFMGANISWAQTFHGREYFRGANILIGSEYFVCKLLLGKRQYLMIFAVNSAQFYFSQCFCNKFCFDFLLQIFVYIFSIYL